MLPTKAAAEEAMNWRRVECMPRPYAANRRSQGQRRYWAMASMSPSGRLKVAFAGLMTKASAAGRVRLRSAVTGQPITKKVLPTSVETAEIGRTIAASAILTATECFCGGGEADCCSCACTVPANTTANEQSRVVNRAFMREAA